MLSVSATHLQSVGVTVQGYAIQFCGMVFADRDVQLLEGRGDGRTSSMVAVLRFAMVATKLQGERNPAALPCGMRCRVIRRWCFPGQA